MNRRRQRSDLGSLLALGFAAVLVAGCAPDALRDMITNVLTDEEPATPDQPVLDNGAPADDAPAPSAESQDGAPNGEAPIEPAVCSAPNPTPEDAAMCLYEAGLAAAWDAAARHATDEVVGVFEQASQDELYAAWEFSGCGTPILLDPPSGISCTFYEPPGGGIVHGVEIELALSERDGVPFFVEIGFVG